MKSFFVMLFLASLSFVACKSEVKEAKTNVIADTAKVEPTTKKTVTGNFVVDPTSSILNWKGDKKLGEAHNGTLKLSEGSFTVIDGKVTTGNATIDMNSIVNIDVTDAKYNAKLVNHLMAADFFDVAKFPTASISITGANDTGFDGKLTIKGIEKSIAIPATVVKEGNNYVVTIANFTFNRTEWNVKYGSGNFFKLAKDKIINDDIQLNGKLVLTPKG